MTQPGPATPEACGAAGANMKSGAKEEAANDANSDSEKQEASSASEMTIKKAVATADNARISLGGAVEAAATKADKDNSKLYQGRSKDENDSTGPSAGRYRDPSDQQRVNSASAWKI